MRRAVAACPPRNLQVCLCRGKWLQLDAQAGNTNPLIRAPCSEVRRIVAFNLCTKQQRSGCLFGGGVLSSGINRDKAATAGELQGALTP